MKKSGCRIAGILMYFRILQRRDFLPAASILASFYWWSNKNDWSHATICIGKNENGVPVITGHTGDIDSEVWNYAVGRSSKMCTILINNGDWQTGDPVNLGDNFYAYILIEIVLSMC